MSKPTTFAAFALALGAQLAIVPARAQDSTQTPKTPHDCLTALQSYAQSVSAQARTSNQPLDRKAVRAEIVSRARTCSANFNLNTVGKETLPELGTLYLVAGNIDAAKQAFKRTINDTTLPVADRSKTILLAMESFLRQRGDSGLTDAEHYLPTLDSMPNSVAAQFEARQMLLGWYMNYDLDDRTEPTIRRMLLLAKSMTADEQQQMAQGIMMAYDGLGTVYGNRLRPDSALIVLRQASTDFPALASVTQQALTPAINRYALIGKKAPALHADYWLNDSTAFPVGNATMLMFTANWCHSCKDSYPTIVKMSQELKNKGFNTVFAVTLDGVFEGKEMTETEEVAANRHYFLDEHGFKFPIAVQRQKTEGASAAASKTWNVDNFDLGGYPQMVIVDKTGVIRAILTGWDPYGNRANALNTILGQIL